MKDCAHTTQVEIEEGDATIGDTLVGDAERCGKVRGRCVCGWVLKKRKPNVDVANT